MTGQEILLAALDWKATLIRSGLSFDKATHRAVNGLISYLASKAEIAHQKGNSAKNWGLPDVPDKVVGPEQHIFRCDVCSAAAIGPLNQRFCSHDCSRKYHGHAQDWAGLHKSTVGAIHELRVAVDLLTKGYEVFRAVTPTGSCDLLALKDRKTFRVEVRAAYENTETGRIAHSKARFRADHYALALATRIVYKPNLEETNGSPNPSDTSATIGATP